MARIIKSPKLPKLKNNKFKCGMCGCKFESHDREIIKSRDDLDNYRVTCPFCESYIILNDHWDYACYPRTLRRIRFYQRIRENNIRLYGKDDD